MLKENVHRLIEDAFAANPSLFLVELSVSNRNFIKVIIDGDAGVTLNDCALLSHYIEQGLEKETTDFSLEISSPGATAPIKNKRQYKKNMGRRLAITLNDGEKIEGTLTAVDDTILTVTCKTRIAKPSGKGKQEHIKIIETPYSEIKEARAILAM